MTRKYAPVFLFRCKICGGQNVLVHEGNPEEKQYKCAHHGDQNDVDSDRFLETGVGTIGDCYEFEDWAVVKTNSAPLTLDHTFAPEEADTLDLEEHPSFRDYFEVVVKDRTSTDVAEERGVTGGTIRANVRHARKMLSKADD